MTTPDSPETLAVDGRTARRDRGRNAVLESALQLFEEGNFEPSHEQIAERAGVSTRSVYRYFENRDELVRAVIAHKQLTVLPYFQIENSGEGELSDRLARFVESRLKVYEAIGATARAMAIKSSSDPIIREQIEFRKSIFRQQIQTYFARELEQMTSTQHSAALNAIDTLTQIESLDRYLMELKLSPDETREILFTAVLALLSLHSRDFLDS